MWRFWGRLGLRARIMGFYAAGGLMLSLTIAVSTLTLARQNLLVDRQERAFPVAARNAARVEGTLSDETEIEDVQSIFDQLTVTDRSFPLLRIGDESASLSPQVFNEESIPPSLRSQIEEFLIGKEKPRSSSARYCGTVSPSTWVIDVPSSVRKPRSPSTAPCDRRILEYSQLPLKVENESMVVDTFW